MLAVGRMGLPPNVVWVRQLGLGKHNKPLDSNVSVVNTVEPRNNSLAFKGPPSIKVNILRSQMIVFNVILPLFKGNLSLKVKIYSPNGTDEAGSYCMLLCIMDMRRVSSRVAFARRGSFNNYSPTASAVGL